jgi:hypothetical protein
MTYSYSLDLSFDTHIVNNRVQKYLFFRIKRRLIRFLNPFDVLKTMVIVSRSNFEHVGSHQGPERAFWAFFGVFCGFFLIFCFCLSISDLTWSGLMKYSTICNLETMGKVSKPNFGF